VTRVPPCVEALTAGLATVGVFWGAYMQSYEGVVAAVAVIAGMIFMLWWGTSPLGGKRSTVVLQATTKKAARSRSPSSRSPPPAPPPPPKPSGAPRLVAVNQVVNFIMAVQSAIHIQTFDMYAGHRAGATAVFVTAAFVCVVPPVLARLRLVSVRAGMHAYYVGACACVCADHYVLRGPSNAFLRNT